jgi:hypothetical protein
MMTLSPHHPAQGELPMTKQIALAPASEAQQNSTVRQPANSKTGHKQGNAARILARAAVTASAVGLAVMALGGMNAYADTLTNGPTVQLGQYSIPSVVPAYVNGGRLLPTGNGTLGNPAAIVLTGNTSDNSANFDVVQIPGNSTNWGTQLATGPGNQLSGQTWYFQRVGYIGVTTPAMSQSDANGHPELLGTPVYMIVNYNPNGTVTCLDGWGGNPGPGSVVDSYGCNPNQVDQTNQLWIVGSPAQVNNTINPATGAFDGGSAPQVFSPTLQGSAPGQSGLQGSVIENVASLATSGWNTAQAPVLSADNNNPEGINSELTLQPQTVLASPANSTWNIVPSTAAPDSSDPSDPPICVVVSSCPPLQIVAAPRPPSQL